MGRKIYLAGPYSSDNVMGMLENIRKGNRMAARLLLMGYAVFNPFSDSMAIVQTREGESLTVEEMYAHSLAWLEVSDGVLVLEGYEGSKGTLAEIRRAEELGIPVFYNLERLMECYPPIKGEKGVSGSAIKMAKIPRSKEYQTALRQRLKTDYIEGFVGNYVDCPTFGGLPVKVKVHREYDGLIWAFCGDCKTLYICTIGGVRE